MGSEKFLKRFWQGSGVVAALLAIAVAQVLQLGWVAWRSRCGRVAVERPGS